MTPNRTALLPACCRNLLFAVFTMALLPGLGAVAATDQDSYARKVSAEKGLVAYWRFQGDLKDSKGSLSGIAKGGDPEFCEGPAGGRAIALRKGKFITMGATPELDLAETTIEFWFRPAFPRDSVQHNPCIVAKRGPGQAVRFSLHISSAYKDLIVWNGGAAMSYTGEDIKLEPQKWYHVAIACNADNMKVYLGGAPAGPLHSDAVFNLAQTNLAFCLGASTPEGSELFEGDIAEVAVYNRVLQEKEIAAHVDAVGHAWADQRKELLKLRNARLEKEAKVRADRLAKDAKAIAARMADPVLVARGEPFVHKGAYLEAIDLPVGGIGAGMIQVNGKAELAVWQIFNNNTTFKVSDSFFAIRVKAGDSAPVVKALQTAAVGAFQAMKSLSFTGAYPFGRYAFDDPDVPVKVSLETFSPLIPLDEKNSGLPCAVFNVTIENTLDKPVEVSVLGSQQNAVGYRANQEIADRKHPWYGSNSIAVIHDPAATLLHMTQDVPSNAAVRGDMVLLAMADKVTASAAWENLDKLNAMFAANGSLPGPDTGGPSPSGETVDGALAVSVTVPPGTKQTIPFVLVWYFPNGVGHWSGAGGNMYNNWWPDALSLARELQKTLPELTRRSRLYADTLYESNLPYWLLDRISSQVAVLRSRTCFWTKDGYFGGWEGCNTKKGCCNGNCDHVWHYAQAHGRLFPGIARRMREQEFRFQQASGGIPHRQPGEFPAFDGQCGSILNSYREHLMSPDSKWLDANWTGITNAMNYVIATWDKDENGVLTGPQWNTLDGALGGSSSWLGSLYLAALSAAERMCVLKNDPVAANRYKRILASGSKLQDETLFNGEHFIQIPDSTPRQDYGNGCHIDQVLGQWWAHQLNLGYVYPADHVRAALASLLKYNFRGDFHGVAQLPRKFVADDDAGLQMITWPKGTEGRKTMQYASEVMSGFEYSAAAAMIQNGLLKEGLVVARAAWERYDGRLRSGLSGGNFTSWGYSGNPFGDDECGKFYARAMSSWSLLLACQGFVYDGPAGLIGFRPVWQPENHSSMFTAAEGWGLFTQKVASKQQKDQIKVVEGRVRIAELLFQLPKGAKAAKVEVKIGDAAVGARHLVSGTDLRVLLDKPVMVEAGSALEVTVGY